MTEPLSTPAAQGTVAKRWLVEETLPGGSIVWSCFEHEYQARQAAANKMKHGDEIVTLTPLYAPSPEALPASGVDVSAIMEMFGRWQSGYAFNDDNDDDVDLEQRVEAEIATLTSAPAPEDRG